MTPILHEIGRDLYVNLDGNPLKDFHRFKQAMNQIVGKRLTWNALTGKETESPTCFN